RAPSGPRATSDDPRSPGGPAPRPARAARPRARSASCAERLLNRAVDLLGAPLAEDVPGHLPLRRDHERAGNRETAVLPEHAPVGIADVRVRDAVAVQELARVTGVVRGIDADERNTVPVALVRLLEARRLAL